MGQKYQLFPFLCITWTSTSSSSTFCTTPGYETSSHKTTHQFPTNWLSINFWKVSSEFSVDVVVEAVEAS